MGKRTVHHMDFQTLVDVNREVVQLTGEPNEYRPADGEKLSSLIKEVEMRADNQDFDDAVSEKAALLVFKVASGQYFRAGNKRTALVAGQTFLRKNGFIVDIQSPDLVSTVDRVGIAAAGLDDLYDVVRKLVAKKAAERKGWDKAVHQIVESNRDFLTKMGS